MPSAFHRLTTHTLQRRLTGLGERRRTPRRLRTERQQRARQAADQFGLGSCRGRLVVSTPRQRLSRDEDAGLRTRQCPILGRLNTGDGSPFAIPRLGLVAGLAKPRRTSSFSMARRVRMSRATSSAFLASWAHGSVRAAQCLTGKALCLTGKIHCEGNSIPMHFSRYQKRFFGEGLTRTCEHA